MQKYVLNAFGKKCLSVISLNDKSELVMYEFDKWTSIFYRNTRKMETHVVIMAGGIGSRFWPMSTQEYPKQFIDVVGCGKSLL